MPAFKTSASGSASCYRDEDPPPNRFPTARFAGVRWERHMRTRTEEEEAEKEEAASTLPPDASAEERRNRFK